MKTATNKTHRSRIAMALLLGSCLVPAHAELTQAPGDNKDLSLAQRPLAELTPPRNNLKVSAWVDHPDNRYRPGDKLKLSFQSNQDAYITVLDIGTSGKVHILFPNQYQKDNRVRAGATTTIPADNARFDLRIGGPGGNELLQVIATKGPAPLFPPDATQPAGPYKTLKKPAPQVAKDLQVVLRRQHNNDWAEYKKVIHIVTAPPTAATPAQAAPAVAQTGLYAASPVQQTPPTATSRFALRLRTDRDLYRIGDPVTVYITPERDCHLTLLDVGTSGRVTRLFPNRYQPDSRIRAGQTIVVPGDTAKIDYRLRGPAGIESLIAICQTRRQAVTTSRDSADPYPDIGNAAQIAKDLAVILRPGQATSAIAHSATTFIVAPAQP